MDVTELPANQRDTLRAAVIIDKRGEIPTGVKIASESPDGCESPYDNLRGLEDKGLIKKRYITGQKKAFFPTEEGEAVIQELAARYRPISRLKSDESAQSRSSSNCDLSADIRDLIDS